MSEYINNSEFRKNSIKNILKKLHEGKGLEDVKAEFAAAFVDLDESEIVQAEQALVNEGLPVEEIQNLCDVHTAVFRDTLNKHTELKVPTGHPIHTFQMENQAAESILMKLKLTLEAVKRQPSPETLDVAKKALAKMREFENHYLRKENLLFPYLEKYQFSGPSSVMWGIHDEIRSGWKKLAALLETGPQGNNKAFAVSINELFSPLETAIREMIYKEEKILFPAAWERLARPDWADIRRQEEQVGYSYIKPASPTSTNQESKVSLPGLVPVVKAGIDNNSMVNLHTGILSARQIDLLLRNLPVDVTYVDENDEVRFFSQTRERIFQRDPAIIGRKVQNCHPPKSLDKVQKIVDDFRSGSRDVAEFWIQMAGKFIHIRYFPLNDDDGTYRGCIEVSQEVSGIRSLEGERRLLAE